MYISEQYLNEFVEKKEIKNSTGPIYLFHGTKMPVDIAKKRGLTIKHNGSNEARIKKPGIWFTSSERYSIVYTKEKLFTKDRKGKVLLCKLDPKFLEFIERPLLLFDEYVVNNSL